MKLFSILVLLGAAVLSAQNVARAADWDFEPKVYLGWMQPGGGVENQGGLVLGGQGKVAIEGHAIRDGLTGKDKIAVLVFAGVKGEGFSNSTGAEAEIKFSEFNLNAGVAVGPNESSWKWRTPLNITLQRDLVANQGFGVRYAFSGLQIRFADDTANEDQVKQVLEFVSDVVVEHFSYSKTDEWPQPECDRLTGICEPIDPGVYPVTDRTIFGLYSKVNYEISKRGWGAVAAAELTQAISRNYTKGDLAVTGYKQFDGEFKALRFFAELRGTVDYDPVDPVSKTQGAGRATFGFSSKF